MQTVSVEALLKQRDGWAGYFAVGSIVAFLVLRAWSSEHMYNVVFGSYWKVPKSKTKHITKLRDNCQKPFFHNPNFKFL